MMPTSFRLPSRLLTLIVFFVALGLLSVGCSESENESQPVDQEKLTPPVQETPPLQEALPQESVETGSVSNMEPARKEVQEQLDAANQAVDNAERLLKQAPRGKGSDLALSALRQDLDSAQTLLGMGQTHFRDQQYSMAKDKAQEADKKANAIIQQVERARDTVKLQSP